MNNKVARKLRMLSTGIIRNSSKEYVPSEDPMFQKTFTRVYKKLKKAYSSKKIR